MIRVVPLTYNKHGTGITFFSSYVPNLSGELQPQCHLPCYTLYRAVNNRAALRSSLQAHLVARPSAQAKLRRVHFAS